MQLVPTSSIQIHNQKQRKEVVNILGISTQIKSHNNKKFLPGPYYLKDVNTGEAISRTQLEKVEFVRQDV